MLIQGEIFTPEHHKKQQGSVQEMTDALIGKLNELEDSVPFGYTKEQEHAHERAVQDAIKIITAMGEAAGRKLVDEGTCLASPANQTLIEKLELLKHEYIKPHGFCADNGTVDRCIDIIKAHQQREISLDGYQGTYKMYFDEIQKLNKFKEYVHKRLDDAGIKTHPEGEHSKHGCRIGDRLDIALLKREQGEISVIKGFDAELQNTVCGIVSSTMNIYEMTDCVLAAVETHLKLANASLKRESGEDKWVTDLILAMQKIHNGYALGVKMTRDVVLDITKKALSKVPKIEGQNP